MENTVDNNEEVKSYFSRFAEMSVVFVAGVARDLGYEDLADNIQAKKTDASKYGEALDNKLKEEWAQYQSMGGVGEYFAQNMTSILASTARAYGCETLAQSIEEKRGQALAYGKAFDDKVKEEKVQFKSMGGISHIGEYVAQNAVSALSEGYSTVGLTGVAQAIEDSREYFVADGRRFDEKVKEEIEQFKSMGGISHVGEYVAQNATSVLSKGYSTVGLDGAAQAVEDSREQIVASGRRFDEKIKEEIEQFNSMGGISHVGEYVAQNATSVLSKGYSTVGLDGAAQAVEDSREQIVANGRKFDEKVKEEIKQYQNMDGFWEYMAQNTTTFMANMAEEFGCEDVAIEIERKREDFLAKGKALDDRMKVEWLKLAQPKNINFTDIHQMSPVQVSLTKQRDSASSNKTLASTYAYKKAEIKHEDNGDGLIKEITLIDGKKHGAEVLYNADGTVRDVKLYNHGQQIDLSKHKVDVKQEAKYGLVHSYVLLDGEKFGTETYASYETGTLLSVFHDKDNVMYRDPKSTVICSYRDNRELLAQNLALQTGDILDNIVAQSQGLRIDKQANKKKQETSKKVATKAEPQSNQQVALAGLKKNNEMSN